MFDYDISTREHHTGKEGEQSYIAWLKKMHINAEDFPFKVKTGIRDKKGFDIWLNVTSWGFYQGSDWRYYVFISYREGRGRSTMAYHWDVDDNGMPIGKPRQHFWNQ